jgi:hypothetical protein
MDKIINMYLYGAIILSIILFIFTSGFLHWGLNRLCTGMGGPMLYSYGHGGLTLSGRVVLSLLIFGIVFGVIDYIYSSLNGDDENVSLN